jgi:PAS domain S-box-containing protein
MNTHFSFDKPGLPKWLDVPDGRAAVQRLRANGYSISNRIFPAGVRDHAVAIGIRVDRSIGDREYFVGTVVHEERLRSLLQEASAPTDWLILVFDRNLDRIVTTSKEEEIALGYPPKRLQQALEQKSSGQFSTDNGVVGRLLVSFARSQLSGWTVAIKVPLDVVDASWNKALRNSAMLGALLLLLTTGIAWITARQMEMPLQALNTTVNETEGRLRAAADSLLRAEARYETFWRHMPESLFAVRVTEDERFVFEGLNPIHERLTGLRQADLANKEPHECLPPDIAAAVTANYQACAKAGEPISYDEVLALPGGRRRWRTSLAPVKDPLTGKTFLIVGSARDVSHDRDARDAAERARRLLQRIMDASPDVIYVYNVIGRRFAFISGRVDEVVGYQPEYFRRMDGARLDRFLHPDDVPSVNAHLASLEFLADGEVTSHEFRILGGDGRYRWIRSKDVTFSRTADGRVAKVVGVARNIDHAKQAQAELESINSRLSTILASISDCYLTIDSDYRITNINQAALEWLGLSSEDAIGKSYFDLRLSSPEHDATVRKVLRRQQAASLEIRSAFNHGRWLDLHFYPTRDGASLFFRDVTERKQAEQEAAHTKELLQSSLDALPAHIAILDGFGTIVAVNKAWLNWAQLRGFQDADLGQNYLVACSAYLRSSADAPRILGGLREIIAGDKDTVRAAYRVTLNERPFWFQLSAARFDLKGVTKIVVSHEDITDVMGRGRH